MEISEINLKLSSLSWTSSNGGRSDEDIRIFPSAKVETEVIGSYDRFALEAQRFEVVSQDGEMLVRPWLPQPLETAVSRWGSVDNEEEEVVSKAA